MQIRRATTKDAELLSTLNDDVQKLHANALPHFFKQPAAETFIPSVIELLNTPDNYFYIGEDKGEAIGYVYAQIQELAENPFRYARQQVIVHHISIRPNHQKEGYGKQLLQAAKTLAQENNISTVILNVWSFNQNARSFFERQGFEVFNERMWLEIK